MVGVFLFISIFTHALRQIMNQLTCLQASTSERWLRLFRSTSEVTDDQPTAPEHQHKAVAHDKSGPLESKEVNKEREKIRVSELSVTFKKSVPEVKPNEYSKIYLVSLGTGIRKPNADAGVKRNWFCRMMDWALGIIGFPNLNADYDARDAQKWGTLGWASGPLIKFPLYGSQDMVDYHLASVFRTLGPKNYIRIQTDELDKITEKMDCATEDNIRKLEQLAKDNVLEGKVKRMNLNNFQLENADNVSKYKDALKNVAEDLHEIYKARRSIIPHCNKEEVIIRISGENVISDIMYYLQRKSMRIVLSRDFPSLVQSWPKMA